MGVFYLRKREGNKYGTKYIVWEESLATHIEVWILEARKRCMKDTGKDAIEDALCA